jgi:hypothetical protein
VLINEKNKVEMDRNKKVVDVMVDFKWCDLCMEGSQGKINKETKAC